MPASPNFAWSLEEIVLCLLIVASGFWLAARHTPTANHECSAAATRRLRWTTLGVIFSVACFLLLRGGDPVGIRVDSWSDSNVLVSGRNYARLGLFANAGAAQHQVVTRDNPNDPFYVYTNYPVGPNLINGLWQSAGITSVRIHRLLPAACSIASLGMWLAIFRRMVGPTCSHVAIIAMATSYVFLAYADNLHFHAYAQFSTAIAMWAFLRWMHPSPGRRNGFAVLAACAMFATAWLTWEYHLSLVLFVLIYPILFRCSISWWNRAVLLLPLFLTFTLQVLQRRAATAGLATAGSEALSGGFWNDVIRRTIGFHLAADTPQGVTLWTYPLQVMHNFYEVYGLPLPALGVLLMTVAWRIRLTSSAAVAASSASSPAPHAPDHTFGRSLCLLIVCGCAWWLVMLQHTSVHPHVMRHMLPAYSLGLAVVVRFGVGCIRNPDNSRGTKAVAAILLLTILTVHLEGAVFDVRLHLKNDRIDPRRRSDGGMVEVDIMQRLAVLVPPAGVILTNHNRMPVMRYYTERPVYQAMLTSYPPDDPIHGRLSIELAYNHLRQLYRDSPPPLYFVYALWVESFQEAYETDGVLQLLLTGDEKKSETSWELKAEPALAEALEMGSSGKGLCPIIGHADTTLVFRLEPALPALHRAFGKLEPPTRREFGPAP